MVITVLPPPIPTEKHKDSDSNHILKNYSEAPTNANNAKKKKKNVKLIKRILWKTLSSPKKTARPVSPLPKYGYSAYYTKCLKFPKPKKGTPLTAKETLESNIRREGVSFANIVSGTTPPPPPPVHKLTEKNNENSNNKVSHGIQAIENENSDLAEVIELVSMISIIKRSPEILQLLPKLKNSEDDKAKALLLLEAITIFEAHSHHPTKATHEKSCACYPIGSCHRFPCPPSPDKEQNQADSKTR
ncbi:hypothetical protein TNCV_1244501 [Trichonephila clavipes]|nr:hypothetical protein TNCV_1244501 [Trichonephila clavipes]